MVRWRRPIGLVLRYELFITIDEAVNEYYTDSEQPRFYRRLNTMAGVMACRAVPLNNNGHPYREYKVSKQLILQ